MNITEVRVRKVAAGGKLKAFASITIDGLFVVHDLKIIEGHKGLFVAMPSRKTGTGAFRDIAHPIATEAREMIQRKIIEEFDRVSAEGGPVEVVDAEGEPAGGRVRSEEPGSAAAPSELGEATPLRDGDSSA